jgi:hypothetical protein
LKTKGLIVFGKWTWRFLQKMLDTAQY